MQDTKFMSPSSWGLLILLGLIWGGSFFFARIAVQDVPPFTLVFLRLSIAALALHVYVAGRFDFYALLRARWRSFLLLGLINNAIPHSFIFIGETHIGAGLAAVLNATTPIWTVLIAHFATQDERLSLRKICGCLAGLCGTAVLIGPGLFASTQTSLWLLLLPVLAAISYGFGAIYSRKFRGTPAPAVAAGQLTASALLVLPVSLIADHPWTLPLPPAATVEAILALALLSTAYGYILFFRLIATAGATNTSLVTLLVPPSAILLGSIFLHERLGPTEIAGFAMIALGLLILDGRAIVPLRRRATRLS